MLFVDNQMTLRNIVFYLPKNVSFILTNEAASFSGDAPPCFYSCQEWTNNTLALEKGLS